MRAWGWAVIGIFGLLFSAAARGQQNFAGAMGGIATLSADTTVEGSPPTATAGYKPENGPSVWIYGGRHLSDHFSVQGSYSWNRNAVLLNGGRFTDGASFALPMQATLHTFAAEGLLYFRNRESMFRPYLSAGLATIRTTTEATASAVFTGTPTMPPSRFSSTDVGLRVAVGIDWKLAERFALRYSFSETIQGNPIGRNLSPQGMRGLANFQNLWGFQIRF